MPIQRLSNAGQSGYRYKSLIAGITPVASVPTIGAATALTYSTASVAFTAPGAYAATTYTATSSPGGLTGTSATSPITVTGLSEQTAYTFTVTATNATGTSRPSASSNSITTPVAWAPESGYDSLATVTLSTSATSITFSGIPSGYKHLQIRGIALGTAASSGPMAIQFNGDTAANYSFHLLDGNGASAAAYGAASNTYARFYGYYDNISNTSFPLAAVVDVLDYTSTTKNKTVRGLAGMEKNGANYGEIQFSSSLWFATPTAITSITIYIVGQSMATYSSFALYGIK